MILTVSELEKRIDFADFAFVDSSAIFDEDVLTGIFFKNYWAKLFKTQYAPHITPEIAEEIRGKKNSQGMKNVVSTKIQTQYPHLSKDEVETIKTQNSASKRNLLDAISTKKYAIPSAFYQIPCVQKLGEELEFAGVSQADFRLVCTAYFVKSRHPKSTVILVQDDRDVERTYRKIREQIKEIPPPGLIHLPHRLKREYYQRATTALSQEPKK